MLRRRHALALAPAVLLPRVLRAQGFPDRPVTLAVGYTPGGSTDIAARLVGERLGATLGTSGRVVVENRSGAAGVIAAEWLRRQAPDGYTLMLAESSSHAIAPAALAGGTRYDPVADFTHLGVVGTAPMILVVNKDFPARSAAEVVARLREAPPDTYTYATSGVAGIPHLGAEMLAVSLGTRFVHVPYRSGGQMLQSIFTGESQFGIAVLASAAQQVRDGMVHGIALTGGSRFAAFPDIPTLAESGIPGFDITTWNIILGPPGLGGAETTALNRALVTALAEPELRRRLLVAGVDAWTAPNASADARAFLEREVAKFRDVVRRTGVRLES